MNNKLSGTLSHKDQQEIAARVAGGESALSIMASLGIRFEGRPALKIGSVIHIYKRHDDGSVADYGDPYMLVGMCEKGGPTFMFYLINLTSGARWSDLPFTCTRRIPGHGYAASAEELEEHWGIDITEIDHISGYQLTKIA